MAHRIRYGSRAVAVVWLLACSPGPVPEFRGEAAWQYLLAQCGYGPRVPGSAAHDSTVAFIDRRLRLAGAEVSHQKFEIDDPYNDGKLRLTNVIGKFSTDRKERVLLAAHFDSRPWADREGVDSLRALPVPGANDGASGVAVLLELADILKGQLPDRVGVDLVFFDGEDYGKAGDLEHYLLGSKHFAANLGDYRPVCGVVLDMVGGKDMRIVREGYSADQAPRLNDALFRRARRLGLDVFVDRRGTSIYDDHVPLLLAGIPTVDLIGFPYAYWHTLADTPENCSQESLRQVGTLIADFLYNFSF